MRAPGTALICLGTICLLGCYSQLTSEDSWLSLKLVVAEVSSFSVDAYALFEDVLGCDVGALDAAKVAVLPG